MKKLVLFDWNGTLLDDTPLMYQAIQEIFRYYKKQPPTLEQYFREYDRDYMSIYRSRGIAASRDELNEIFVSMYELNLSRVVLQTSVVETLRDLHAARVSLGLVTAMPAELVIRFLVEYGIGRYFSNLRFSVRNKSAKIRELYLWHKCKPQNCFYVGDTPSDMRDAKKAGVVSVAFSNGYTSDELLESVQPDHLIHDLRRVVDIAVG